MDILNPLGEPQVLLILALMVLALWKKGWLRAILSICIITWGAFAIPYDIKIAAPLVGIGTVLFIISVLRLMGKEVADNE